MSKRILQLVLVAACAVAGSALMPPPVWAAPFTVSTGSYIGDGSQNRAITGLLGRPALVMVSSTDGETTILSTASMPAGAAKELGQGTALQTGAILSLDPTGFTVGSDPRVNEPGVRYHWQAFTEEPGTFEVRSYVGTGLTLQYSLGFEPDYVMVLPASNDQASQRFAETSGDASFEFKDSGVKANRITAFTPNGLRLGTHSTVNESGRVYYLAAWRRASGSIHAGTYLGTGSPFGVTAPGMEPSAMLLRRFGNDGNLARSSSMAGDTAVVVFDGQVLTGGITSLDATGFSVGTGDPVNKLGDTYGFVAFSNQALSVISQIQVRDRAGTATTIMTPFDTLFVDATIAQPNGFASVNRIEFELFYSSNYQKSNAPALRALFSWTRNGSPKWQIDDPTGTTWALVPGLCQIDSVTNSTAPQVVRLAFVPSRIATASSSGQWTIEVRSTSLPGPATVSSRLRSLNVPIYFALTLPDTAAQFSAGAPGVAGLPLRIPGNGALEFQIVSNASTRYRAKVTDLVGATWPSDTMHVGSPTPRIRFRGFAGDTGRIDTAFIATIDGPGASSNETPQSMPLALWIDHPPGLPDQSYRGTFTFRTDRTPYSEVQIPIQATITSSGLAASGALAEIAPDAVTAGTSGQSFTLYVAPIISPGESGVDRIIVPLPPGYSNPVLTEMRVNDIPVPHADSSKAGQLDARLGSAVVTPSVIQVTFAANVPTPADTGGGTFGALFDDSRTPGVPPQTATAGNANPLAGNDGLDVVVRAGPAATIESLPDSVQALVGDTLRFVAVATDAFGNEFRDGIAWSTSGGVGTIDALGLFTATAIGTGMVVASTGSARDTSRVVTFPSISVEAGSVSGPAFATRGQTGLQTLLRVSNPNAEAVQVDSVRWTVTRAVPGDANADILFAPDPSNPSSIPAGTSKLLRFDTRVRGAAAPGTVDADAAVYVTGISTLQAVHDDAVDSTWTVEIQDPPFFVATPGSLLPTRVTAGSSNVGFSIDLTNVGQAALATATGSELRIVAAADSAVAPVGGTGGPWTFGPATIPAGLTTGRLPLRIALKGTDANGAAFSQALWAADSIDVMAATPVVTVNGVQTPQTLLPGGAVRVLLSLEFSTNQSGPIQLQSFVVDNATSGPGSPAQRDAELTPLSLFMDDGNGVFSPGADTFLGQQALSGGQAVFGPFAMSIPGGAGVRRLFVVGAASLAARDGDSLDVSIASAANFTFDRPVDFSNTWPLTPAGRFAVDGMTAAQVAFTALPEVTLFAGTTRNPVLHFVVPANGYEPDTLRRLNIVNEGTAVAGSDIQRLEAWADDGDDAFDPAVDRRLGVMSFTGDRWELTGIREPVPAAGRRIFVSCDLADLVTEGHTIRLELPSAFDVGLGMASTNDGPIDVAAGTGDVQSISSANRITLTAHPGAGTPVRPGQKDVILLHLNVANTYSVAKTLASVTLTHATVGTGSQDDFDRNLSSLALRSDDDDDGELDDGTNDPTLATGFFSAGRMTFSDINWTLAPGESRDLFVTGQVALLPAADGDAIAVRVNEPADVSFADPTVLAASWPLAPGASRPIDGMVARQITRFSAPVRTVGAGEGPALALDVRIPRNGYRDDVLRGLRLRNQGSAAAADLGELSLWLDGGDGVFNVGAGDDANLGPFVHANGTWTSPLLNVPLGSTGARLFVAATAATTPADSVTLQLAIPIDGITVDSENDGPVDSAVVSPDPLLISNALLLTDLSVNPAASTVGQTVTVRMDVRNAGPDSILSIAPGPLTPSGSAGMQALTGPAPAQIDLAPGATGSFTWTWRSDGSGTFQASGRAAGTEAGTGTPRSSLLTGSNVHRVFVEAQAVQLYPVESMPFSVSRGQSGVVPLSLTFRNPAGSGASDVRLLGMRIRLANESGAGIVPADLLGRVVVSEGSDVYLEKSSLETTGDIVDLTLAQPVSVPPGDASSQVTLNLRLDISPSTTVPRFRLVITDANAFTADDATSGAPIVPQLSSGSFPVQSGLAQVGAEAVELRIAAQPDSAFDVGRGQRAVRLLSMELTNADPSGLASDIRLSGFDVSLADSAGQPVAAPADFLERVRIVGPMQTHLDRAVDAGDDGALRLTFSTPILLRSNAPVPVRVEADLRSDAPPMRIAMVLDDSASVSARDASTSSPVAITLVPGPIAGGIRTICSRTDSVLVRRVAGIAPAVTVGQTGAPVMTVRWLHPGPGTAGAVTLHGVTFECRDQLDNAIAPATYVGRVAVRAGGQTVGSVAPSGPGAVTVPFAGVTVSAADSVLLEVEFDVSPAAPEGQFKFVIPVSGWDAEDANLLTAVAARPAPGATWPVESGITRVQPPARELFVSASSTLPPTLAGDGRPVTVATMTFSNPAATDAGDVRLDHLDLFAGNGGFAPLPVGDVAAGFEAWTAGRLWASTVGLAPGATSARLAGADTLRIEPGEPLEVELRLIPRSGATAPAGLRIGFDGQGIGVVQPGSALLTVAVRATAPLAFPFWTQAAQFSALSLEQSFTNFPNPFAAGRDETHFAFYLSADARVTLRIWTARGERVKTVADDVAYPAGLHQVAAWDGRNGAGATVQNGVYGAELIVRYADGKSERLIRRVAVVR